MLEMMFNMGLLHRIRGMDGKVFDVIPNRVIVLIGVFLAAWDKTRSIALSLSTMIGYFIFIIWGWGAYFIHPDDFKLEIDNSPRQKEIPVIDWIIGKLPPYRLLQNFCGMMLRALFAAPMFVALAVFGASWLPIFCIPIFCLAMGVSYAVPPYVAHITGLKFDYNAFCEAMTGAYLGFILGKLFNA